MTTDWDAVVIGAGSAGLAAALTLTRARRRTLVLDTGEQRNRFAAHSHGVLGSDGEDPAALVTNGRAEVIRYGAVLLDGRATGAHQDGDRFTVTTSAGQDHTARCLVVATGVRDELPEVPGLAPQWGTGVVVCPYCDGWESRDQRIGVLGTGPRSVAQAQLVRQWSADIVLLTNTTTPLSEDDRAALSARGIAIRDGTVDEICASGGTLTGVRVDGEHLPLDRVFTTPRPVPHDEVLRQLGARTAARPHGDLVVTTGRGATSVTGVWAAGNVVDPSLKVPTAAGDGMAAGAEANEFLVRADITAALNQTRPATAQR